MKKKLSFAPYMAAGYLLFTAIYNERYWMILLALVPIIIYEFFWRTPIDYSVHDEICDRLQKYRDEIRDARDHKNYGLVATLKRDMILFEQTIEEDDSGRFVYKKVK